MAKKDLILIGGGAHCKICIDVIELEGKFKIVGIVDMKHKLHQEVLGYKIIATDEELPGLVKKFKNCLITFGGIKDFSGRVRTFEYLKELGAQFPVIISPLAYVSKSAVVEEGTIVMHKSLINTGAKVGKNCIVNAFALIEHDNKIGDHCHISAGAVVNGSCTIGRKVFIGSNSVVGDQLEIVDEVTIGAGSYVAKSITQPGVYIAPGKLVGVCKI